MTHLFIKFVSDTPDTLFCSFEAAAQLAKSGNPKFLLVGSTKLEIVATTLCTDDFAYAADSADFKPSIHCRFCGRTR